MARSLTRDDKGASSIEFAIALPVLILMIIGILQLGIVFYANAGLRQGVEEGARYATIYPTPTDAQIIARVSSQKFGPSNATAGTPTVTHGTNNGINYVDVAMSYTVPLNFIFYAPPPITLNYSRRAYMP